METTPPDKTETKLLNGMLPQALMERTQSFCAERGITIQEFLTDAIIEKLERVYKERRKKPRL
jgi:hypothetical protein